MRAFKLQLRVRNITYVDRSWVQCIRKYIDIGYWHICHHAYIEQCIFVLQNQMRVVSIVLIFVMSSERKGRGLPALSMLQAGFNFPSSHRQKLGALQRPLPHRPSSHRAVIKSRISQAAIVGTKPEMWFLLTTKTHPSVTWKGPSWTTEWWSPFTTDIWAGQTEQQINK